MTKNEMILASAAELQELGIEIDKRRRELIRLAAEGGSLSSPEMILAAKVHGALSAKWQRLEAEHLRLIA